MNRAIVGCLVGFPVGKLCPPDKPQRRVINDLRVLCRKCRVATTEETPGEIESLQAHRRT
jgi:uncharacterized protein (UPF0262 family)